MGRKSKIFLSLASLCLSLMVLCFGVYSAVSVDYTISGSVSYEVDSAFVEIETRVYSINLGQPITTDEFSELASAINLNVLSFDEFEGILTSEAGQSNYQIVKKFPVYNSLTNEGEPNASGIEINYDNSFVYIILINVKNLSDDNVIDVAVSNDIENSQLNSNIYRTPDLSGLTASTNSGKGQNIAMGFSLADATKNVDDEQFSYTLNVTQGEKPQTIVNYNTFGIYNGVISQKTTNIDGTKLSIVNNDYSVSGEYTLPTTFDIYTAQEDESSDQIYFDINSFLDSGEIPSDVSEQLIVSIAMCPNYILSNQLFTDLFNYGQNSIPFKEVYNLNQYAITNATELQYLLIGPLYTALIAESDKDNYAYLASIVYSNYASIFLGTLQMIDRMGYGSEIDQILPLLGFSDEASQVISTMLGGKIPQPYSEEEKEFIIKLIILLESQDDTINLGGLDFLGKLEGVVSVQNPLNLRYFSIVPGDAYRLSDFGVNSIVGFSNISADTIKIPSDFNFQMADTSKIKTKEFVVDDSNSLYKSQDGVLFTKDMSTLVAYPSGKTQAEYIIPDSVTTVLPTAFLTSNGLDRVVINYSIIKDLSNFRSTPSTLVLRSQEYISRFEAANWSSDYIADIEIEYVDVSSSLVYEERGNGYYVTAYTPQDGKTMVLIPSTYKPDNGEELSVIGIAANAFSGATNLENIGLPETIQVIESNAFDGAVNVKFVDFGNAEITSYGANVFGNRKDIIIYTQNETTKDTIKQATPNSTSTNISLTIETGIEEGSNSSQIASQRGSFDMVFTIDGHEFKVDTTYDMQLSTLYNGYMIISSENSGEINVSVSANINAEAYGTSQTSTVDHIQEQIAIAKVENGETILIDGTPVDENYYNHPGGTATATYSGTATVGDELKLVVNFTVMTYVQCFTEGTLVTLADGSTKPIEDVTYDDLLLVWDFDRGEFSYSYPVWIAEGGTYNNYYLMKFDDGSEVEIVLSHRLFDVDGLSFEKSIDAIYSQVGDRFFRQTIDENGNPKITTPTCISIEKINESCKYYNMVTSQSLNFFANGFLGATGVANMYTFEKTDDGRYIHNQEQLQDTKYNGDVFAYDMFDSSIVPYEIYIAYRLGETKNMADILAKAPPYNQYPIKQVYQIAVKLIEDYFPESYFEDIVALPDTYKITTSEGVSTRVDKGETYTLESPKDLADFEGYYNTFDGKMYMPGDEVTIYMNTHFIARYSA